MTKFVHMTPPPQMAGKSHAMPLWPIVIAGALLAATWSGVSSDVVRSSSLQTVQLAFAALKPLASGVYSYLDGH